MNRPHNIKTADVLDCLLSVGPISVIYIAGVRFFTSAFTPFDYLPLLTILSILSTVLSFMIPLFALNCVFVILVLASFLVFGVLLRNRRPNTKAASAILSYLFIGKSALHFLNFIIFLLLIIANIVGVVLSWPA